MQAQRKIEAPFLPETMVQQNPGLELVLADLTKRLAPKPAVFESAYECGEFTVHYKYYFDPDEPEREIVTEILCYTRNCRICDGQCTVDYPGTTDGAQMDCSACYGRGQHQVSSEELQEHGLTVPDALRLQEWLNDAAWEARNES